MATCQALTLLLLTTLFLYLMARRGQESIRMVPPSEPECLKYHNIKRAVSKLVQPISTKAKTFKPEFVQEYELDPNKKYPMLPKCIIIGTPKGGTLALRKAMTLHSKIAEASLKGNTQISFFNTYHVKGFVWYLENMPLVYPDQIVVEKTPQYFYSQNASMRMREMDSDMKIIICVRDPVERLISKLAMDYRRGTEESSMEELLLTANGTSLDTKSSYILKGCYSEFLKEWLVNFPLKQIHFVDSDLLAKKPWEAMQQVESFLGLLPEVSEDDFILDGEKGFYCLKDKVTGEPDCLSRGKGYPHPELPGRLRKMLVDYFRPFNKEFVDMTGLDFGWQ